MPPDPSRFVTSFATHIKQKHHSTISVETPETQSSELIQYLIEKEDISKAQARFKEAC